MNSVIDVFIPFNGDKHREANVNDLLKSNLVNKVFLIATDVNVKPIDNCELVFTNHFVSSETTKKIAEKSEGKYSLILTKNCLSWNDFIVLLKTAMQGWFIQIIMK